MKKNGILIGVVLLVLLLVGGYFVMSKKGEANVTGGGEAKKGETTEVTGNKGQNTLKELLLSNIPQSCTFKVSVDEYKSEGNIYTAQGKMRGDFTATVEGKEMKSHMIVDGNTSYIWSDGEEKGFKTAITDEQKEDIENIAKENSDGSAMVDLDTKVDYDCKPWLVNGSYFNAPGNVEFVSIDEMMKEFQNEASDQCAICDSLSGDQKTQCLTSLNCD